MSATATPRLLARLAAAAVLVCTIAPTAAAQQTFESFSGGSGTLISIPLGGFSWTNFFVTPGCTLDGQIGSPNYGYCAGVVSGIQVVFNGYGEDASISRASAFTFGGAWLSAAFTADPTLSNDIRPNAATAVLVTGYAGPTQVYSTLFDIAFKAPRFFAANWAGIDRLEFSSHLTADNPGGNQFVMDDIYFESVPTGEVVPEPATLTLLATGLVGMTAGRRRKRKS